MRTNYCEISDVSNAQKKLIKELEDLDDEGARMDAVAADLWKKNPRYASIDASTLAELLGLDPDENADWGREFYASRTSVDDLGEDQPCAENIELLKGYVPADRYTELKARAQKALKSGGSDIRIRKEERRLLEEELTTRQSPFPHLVYISMNLESSSGECLEFEGVVGDGGEVCEFYGPYELMKGEGVDIDDYVCIE